MQFDSAHRRPSRPATGRAELSDQELDALQDAHLASQADRHAQGYLVAAGVVTNDRSCIARPAHRR